MFCGTQVGKGWSLLQGCTISWCDVWVREVGKVLLHFSPKFTLVVLQYFLFFNEIYENNDDFKKIFIPYKFKQMAENFGSDS